MSRRGNDLVRRYLWMAALSAVRCNPAVRALYARVVRKHPNHKAIAIGHAMRKLLHLAFAVWKTGKPFDPAHYPWAMLTPDDAPAQPGPGTEPGAVAPGPSAAQATDLPMAPKGQAAGHRDPDLPERKVVTAACLLPSLPERQPPGDNASLDFAHIKRQLPMRQVLDQLGLSARLRGRGPQQRCPCPIHRGDARGRSFSVNLDENVFCCHDPTCGRKGDVIDLWAGVHGLSLREAALDLVRTFHLEAAP
jgi:hypothetical protein